jgi:hypothetical protein
MAIFNTRLIINSCALSSRKVFIYAPLFGNMEDMEFRVSVPSTFLTKNKGATVDTQTRVGYRNAISRLRNSIIDTK